MECLLFDVVMVTERSFTLPASATSYKFTNLMPYTNYTMRMGALAREAVGPRRMVREADSHPGVRSVNYVNVFFVFSSAYHRYFYFC